MQDSAPDPFDSATRLWARASTLMDELRQKEEEFFTSDSVGFYQDVDFAAGYKSLGWRVIKDPPQDTEYFLKDSLTNLRDALDHAVHAASSVIAGRHVRYTAFPFARTDSGVRDRLRHRALRDVPEALHPFLENLKPYEGGNEWLFGLNELRNPSTHQKILPMAASVGTHGINIDKLLLGPGSILLGNLWEPNRKRIELARLSLDAEGRIDLNVRAYFVIASDNPFAGRAVSPILYKMRDEVARVIRELRDETARLRGD